MHPDLYVSVLYRTCCTNAAMYLYWRPQARACATMFFRFRRSLLEPRSRAQHPDGCRHDDRHQGGSKSVRRRYTADPSSANDSLSECEDDQLTDAGYARAAVCQSSTCGPATTTKRASSSDEPFPRVLHAACCILPFLFPSYRI